MLSKKELRAKVRKLKAAHTVGQMDEMSQEICRCVCSDGLWRTAGTVLLYHPLADEVDVRPLIRHACSMGHRVLLPVVQGQDLVLKTYEGDEALAVSPMGILEPVGETFSTARYSEIRLVVVPGMAFDQSGHRLGRGKGYYDRLLPLLPEAYRVGVCFPFQLMEDIPYEVHDIRMHEVICASEMLYSKNSDIG